MNFVRELETLLFIIVASALGLFAVFYLRQPQMHMPTNVTSPLPTIHVAEPTTSPTPGTAVAPQTTERIQVSPDGTQEVVMDKTTGTDMTTQYTFALENTATKVKMTLLTTTPASTSSYMIPFNTFSPDDAYVFLQEKTTDQTNYFVFQSSGQTFGNGAASINITPLFASYAPSDTLVAVTGWADPTLLVVNAKSASGTLESFWFDMKSLSFIPLAHTFE